MLIYLDNATSTKGHINENYGRELLELHTVGVNSYAESDVVGAANTLTGWTVAKPRQGGAFRFAANLHDDTPQRVLTWSTPAGTTGQAQGESLLTYLAHHPSTATFLATKLVTRFVSDRPDPGLVAGVAKAYLAADTDITATLRALFADEHFFTTATAKVRRPEELFVAALRATGATVAGSSSAGAGSNSAGAGGNSAGAGGNAKTGGSGNAGSSAKTGGTGKAANAGAVGGPARQLVNGLKTLGQPPFGWPAPNGYPDVGGAWLNAGTLLSRWNLAADLVAGRLPGVQFDPHALGIEPGTATDPGRLIAQLANRLLGADPDSAVAAAVQAGMAKARPADQPATAAALLLSTTRFQYR
jgi:uncharacterized protein (DUF1800 family)